MSGEPETAEEMVGRVECMSRGEEPIDFSERDIAALKFVLETRAELLAALRDLTASNEQWNEAAEKVIGRPPQWNDAYLNRARWAVAEADGQ